LNCKIVFAPDVVTVGEPVDVAEYEAVGTLNITTPFPPAKPSEAPAGTPEPFPPPPPPPVFAVPAVGEVEGEIAPPFPPPPTPPTPPAAFGLVEPPPPPA